MQCSHSNASFYSFHAVTMAEPILVSTAVIALVGIMPAVLVFLILFVVQKCRNRQVSDIIPQATVNAASIL